MFAVAGGYLAKPFDRVWIHRTWEAAAADPVAMGAVDRKEFVPGWDEYGKSLSDADRNDPARLCHWRRSVEISAVGSLAGPLAESRCRAGCVPWWRLAILDDSFAALKNTEADTFGCEHDMRQAIRAGRQLEKWERPGSFFCRISDQTADLLDDTEIWHAVMSVAEALRERDLSFDAVGEVIKGNFGEQPPDIFGAEWAVPAA